MFLLLKFASMEAIEAERDQKFPSASASGSDQNARRMSHSGGKMPPGSTTLDYSTFRIRAAKQIMASLGLGGNEKVMVLYGSVYLVFLPEMKIGVITFSGQDCQRSRLSIYSIHSK